MFSSWEISFFFVLLLWLFAQIRIKLRCGHLKDKESENYNYIWYWRIFFKTELSCWNLIDIRSTLRENWIFLKVLVNIMYKSGLLCHVQLNIEHQNHLCLWAPKSIAPPLWCVVVNGVYPWNGKWRWYNERTPILAKNHHIPCILLILIWNE